MSEADILASDGEQGSGKISARVTLRNKRGMHARAAAKFAARAQDFDAEIRVTSHNDVCQETVVGDSIMELLLLGSACGEDISISASGHDAETALAALVNLVENRFGENE
ncbi:MAG: HPr family phosphocarrier protein [Acidimicrobiales bacterium]|nr:HPr family phosphocarrier protein [Hyphomonadaceae bacterium]RZV45030.1 MAG: HPr family phosphocarrier protein [Acidimicrobiales bacterium]